MQVQLKDIAERVAGVIHGEASCLITGIASLQNAKPGQITFLHNSALNQAKYEKYLKDTQASAVILNKTHAALCPTNAVIVEDPYYAYAVIAELFAEYPQSLPGIHPTAVIGQNCHIDPSVSVGPQVVIGDQVTIGPHTQIDAGCIIGNSCRLGKDCHLWPRVTVYYGVTLGNRVILHSGVVIGADGFGWTEHHGQWCKIPQLGSVVLRDDVDVGANTTIDRGALSDTVIGRGVKIDNLVQIAHNVQIGDHTIIAGCAGVAGSAEIGKHCMIGGGSCITGHIQIVDGACITGMGMITNSILKPGRYTSGTGFLEHTEWRKNAVRFRQLNDMAKQIKLLFKNKPSKEGMIDE